SGKSDWEEFVEQNKDIIEAEDPGGQVLTELITARGGSETLGERLDSEKAEFTAQLAHIAINVKSSGAVGDGETDDTESIQNALDYIGSVGGGTVLIPTGTYMIDGTGTGEFWKGKGL